MAAQGGPAEWYAALPPITKAWFTSAILTGVAAKLEILDYKLLLLNWIKVIDKLHLWRLVTTFLFFGGPSFSWLITMMMLSRFSAALENAPIPSGGGAHNGNVADYCWMLLLGMCTLLGLGSLVGMPILSLSLFMMVVYVWSKRHPGEQVTFYMFRMEAQYLPWCMIIFSFVVGNDIVPDLMGIAAGHLYYFLQEELPGAETVFKGWHALRTPSVLYTAWGVPPTNAAAAVVRMRQAQAGAGGPQAPVQRGHLWGQGQALGGGR